MKEKIELVLGRLLFVWVVLALSFEILMIVLSFTNPALATRIGNECTWALDGRFK